MNYYLYFFASLTIMILGIGHISIDLASRYFLNFPDPEIYNTMISYELNVFGFTRNLHEFFRGFSITMGVFMVAFGGLNVLIINKVKEVVFKYPSISLLNAILCLVVFALSLLFFHWPPIIFFFLSFLIFITLFIRLSRKKK